MRTIGFVVSHKENERRRALLPGDLQEVRHTGALRFEEGYGVVLGFPDEAYVEMGAEIVSKAEAYRQDVVCALKTPSPARRGLFGKRQTMFGWIHAVQGRSITDFLLEREMTGIAWEDMFEDGRHCFWRNNEIAGEAAVMHSACFIGRLPQECKAAVIGRGNCARGAYKALARLGADVRVYDRKTVHKLPGEIGQFDIVANAVLWDVFCAGHLICRDDLARMKPGSIIVDISCDRGMGVETGRPTTIENPVYVVDGILHYAVDHTPALFYRSASESISAVVCRYVDQLAENNVGPVLEQATVIRDGAIIDERISLFQKR